LPVLPPARLFAANPGSMRCCSSAKKPAREPAATTNKWSFSCLFLFKYDLLALLFDDIAEKIPEGGIIFRFEIRLVQLDTRPELDPLRILRDEVFEKAFVAVEKHFCLFG